MGIPMTKMKCTKTPVPKTIGPKPTKKPDPTFPLESNIHQVGLEAIDAMGEIIIRVTDFEIYENHILTCEREFVRVWEIHSSSVMKKFEMKVDNSQEVGPLAILTRNLILVHADQRIILYKVDIAANTYEKITEMEVTNPVRELIRINDSSFVVVTDNNEALIAEISRQQMKIMQNIKETFTVVKSHGPLSENHKLGTINSGEIKGEDTVIAVYSQYSRTETRVTMWSRDSTDRSNPWKMTKEWAHVEKPNNSHVTCSDICNGRIALGTEHGNVHIYRPEGLRKSLIPKLHTSLMSVFFVNENLILTGGTEGNLCLTKITGLEHECVACVKVASDKSLKKLQLIRDDTGSFKVLVGNRTDWCKLIDLDENTQRILQGSDE